jgi:ubiquinone/menaquinone biosynthesis C-methylase UbiE
MSTPPDSRHELSSTYIVQDHSNQEELARLHIQDQMITTAMGGVLSEQSNPSSLRRILDIGCGTGDWLIEAARTYPDISLLVGVDANHTMIEYARARAKEQQLSNRVEFHVMDVLRMIEFPTGFFDLVNERFALSFVRTWEWSKLFTECQRVTRPDGIVRLTELDTDVQSSSPALTRLNDLFNQALSQSGHTFLSKQSGKTAELVPLLTRHGIQDLQTQEHTITFRAGTVEGQRFYEDMARLYHTIRPFLRQWLRIPNDYETTYQQALREMQQPDFLATWRLLTVWGMVPLRLG